MTMWSERDVQALRGLASAPVYRIEDDGSVGRRGRTPTETKGSAMLFMQNLLVVDWDYFFEEKTNDPELWALYDWGHSEAGGKLYSDLLWVPRAAAFQRAGLPVPVVNDERLTFWDRFNVHDDAVLYYADSNVHAIDWRVRASAAEQTAQVWLYDAHHDSGYRGKKGLAKNREDMRFTCEDWMVAYHLEQQSKLHVRYPRWRAWALDAEPEPPIPVDRQVDTWEPNPVEFHAIFVCRSGSWTPPWCDGEFNDFLGDAPVREIVQVDESEDREWDQAEVDNLNELWSRVAELEGA